MFDKQFWFLNRRNDIKELSIQLQILLSFSVLVSNRCHRVEFITFYLIKCNDVWNHTSNKNLRYQQIYIHSLLFSLIA